MIQLVLFVPGFIPKWKNWWSGILEKPE